MTIRFLGFSFLTRKAKNEFRRRRYDSIGVASRQECTDGRTLKSQWEFLGDIWTRTPSGSCAETE